MVETDEQAPDFRAPLAGGSAYNDIESFVLSEALGDGPLVLAFFPAAFTSGCTEEMCEFRDSMTAFDELDAEIYGISVDLPFAQNRWIQEHDLGFAMVSDWKHEIIQEYDVVYDDMYGTIEVAQRSIFVLDSQGTISYRWVREGENPDFEELLTEVRRAVAETVKG
jgi:peroxiredoxin